MTQTEKFLFKTSFDEGALAREAERARKARAPSYGEEELAEAKGQAFAEGKQAGLAEALTGAEQAAASALAKIERELLRIGEAITEVNQRRERRAIEVAVMIVRKLFPRMAAKGGLEEIEALIEDCLAQLEDEPRIVVRVGDAQLDALKERLDAIAQRCGFEGRTVLLAEPGLGPGDARVEWADGGAEHDAEALWAKIDGLLSRTLLLSEHGPQTEAPEKPEALPHAAPASAHEIPPQAEGPGEDSPSEAAAPEPQIPETQASV